MVHAANEPTLNAAVAIVDLCMPSDYGTRALEEKQPLILPSPFTVSRTSDAGRGGSGGCLGHINSPRCLVGETRAIRRVYKVCLMSRDIPSGGWPQPNTTVDCIRREFLVRRSEEIDDQSKNHYVSKTKKKICLAS